MTFETLSDTQSLFDSLDSGVVVYLGGGNNAAGVFDRVFDEGLEINGHRSAVRIINSDADLVAVDAAIKITDSYTDPPTETNFIVREKQRGQRTTLLVLEAS